VAVVVVVAVVAVVAMVVVVTMASRKEEVGREKGARQREVTSPAAGPRERSEG
jgi:hypothetical protein